MNVPGTVEPATAGRRSAAPPRPVGERDLVGRATELNAVHAFLDAAAAHGGALVLTGERGVGKTALLDAAVARARSRAASVLRCAGDPTRAGLAPDTLADLLRQIRPEQHRLDGTARSALSTALLLAGGRSPDRLRLCTATLAVLRAVGRERPLLVAVDDLHQLDRDSATTLAFVARRLAGSRVGLLATVDTGGEGAGDGRTVGPSGLAQLPLASLADADAARLVREDVPGLAAHLVRRVVAEAVGNPSALRELAATAARFERPVLPPSAAVLPLTPRLQERYARRIRALPAMTGPALLAVAPDERLDDGRTAARRLQVGVLADPARVSRSAAVSLDAAIRGLAAEIDPLRITWITAAGLALDRVVECREPLRRVLDGARVGRAAGVARTAGAILCAGDVATGRWDEADDLAERGIESGQWHGQGSAAPLRLAQAVMAAARGDEVRVRALLDAVVGRGVQAVGEQRRVLALAALGRGDAEAAYLHATAVTPAGQLASGPAALRVSMDLVEAAVRLGRREEARRHVRAMRDAPVHAVSARFAMLTAASAALVAGPEDAATLFDEALAAPDAERWPFDQARVQLAYGEHLRRQRRVGPSRVLLVAALDTFERLAARPWATYAQHGLRATGVTIGRPVDQGAADLTPDERTVAVLAAAGLTNKQIAARLMVSHHTVAARLYQAFPKLGVGSRAALRLAMLAPDAAPDGRSPDTALVSG